MSDRAKQGQEPERYADIEGRVPVVPDVYVDVGISADWFAELLAPRPAISDESESATAGVAGVSVCF